ncbi:MAG: alpha-hydroxy-acid oxidizing protein [Halobacteriales archaeon]|nr:alpha-hydroxy-acid oxidizing protein [Halobacteriales archaeon]
MPDESTYGRARQAEVYLAGTLAGQTPDIPPRYEALEAAAEAALSPEAHAYVAGSAGAESTADANRAAFDEWRLVPRPLRDVSSRDLSVELFGREWPAPVGLAPIGVQGLLHDDGERPAARAAATLGLPFAVSSASSVTLEAVADALDGAPGWFQLYPSADRAVTESLLERAEAAGYEAVVVTVDTPTMGWRPRDLEQGYLPFLEAEGVANYFEDPAFRAGLDAPPEEDRNAAVQHFLDVFGDTGFDLEALAHVRELTDLPVIVKGLVHPDDAERALEHADGVVVSTHGGRQVDRALPALEALPDVVDRIGDDAPVLFDSGIRNGADVAVALALGADAVLLGRPYAYGLALEGEAGVLEVCRNLLADLDLTLALTGHRSPAELGRGALSRA